MDPRPAFPRSSPYWPVVSHPLLRRVLPGLAVSAVGDGMSVVAISWLALQLAPDGRRATWLAVGVAAYSLPSAAGGVLFARFLAGRSGAQLAGWNAILRGASLAAIVGAYALGVLDVGLYVALLAVSSLLAAWGSAGRYTLIAELLPTRHHLPGNAVLTVIGDVATIVGPPLAGILIGWAGAVTVLALDAASFAVLAVTYRLAIPRAGAVAAARATTSGARTAGFGAIRRDRALLGVLVLSFGFFFLFGPFYAAMPIHVAEDLHASATVLGAYYTAFGVGAVVGGLVTGYLRRWSLWPTTIGIVLGFGAAMLPLGLGAPAAVSVVSFAVAGAIWAPYMSASMALFQRSTPTERLPQVLAANGSLLALAVPLGTVAGGPLTATMGARPTLLLCAIATIGLGLVAAALIGLRRRGTPPPSSPPPQPRDPGPAGPALVAHEDVVDALDDLLGQLDLLSAGPGGDLVDHDRVDGDLAEDRADRDLHGQEARSEHRERPVGAEGCRLRVELHDRGQLVPVVGELLDLPGRRDGLAVVAQQAEPDELPDRREERARPATLALLDVPQLDVDEDRVAVGRVLGRRLPRLVGHGGDGQRVG
jgi:DHA3 family macrolide efflux protein-like MFS transporter